MATARPGWSRRAQYGLFFTLLGVIAGVIIGLVLLALSLVAPKSFESVRGTALDLTGPVAGALHEVTATASGLASGAGNYWDAARQNGALKQQRRQMLERMVEARAVATDQVLRPSEGRRGTALPPALGQCPARRRSADRRRR